jgi:N6-adenosine-specific RNA methylase IME4
MGKVTRLQALRPIVLGCFTLGPDGLEVRGRPTLDEHLAAGDFIQRSVQASGWWWADWLAYGDTREEWRAQLEHVLDHDILTYGTAKQYRYVAKAVPKEQRVSGVPFHHHQALAACEPALRHDLLHRAKEQGWNVSELRKQMRVALRRKVLEGQATLEGMFRVIYADPPWLYSDSGVPDSGALGKASRHYDGMPLEDLCALPVEAHAHADSVLFLWVTSPMLPNAFPLIDAWGFTYKTGIVWDKVLHAFGHYVGVHHEHLLIATRGSCLPDNPTPMPDSVQVVRRGDVHSEKPEHFRRLIEQLYGRGPYLELFARKQTPGWTCLGNDARLWPGEMEQQHA